MFLRHIATLLQRSAQAGPVLLQGPRGAGKTTLVRGEFAERLHLDLNDPADRQAARRDPASFLSRMRRPAVVDELQRCPELVQYLRRRQVPQQVVFVADVRLPLKMPLLELHPPTRAERLRRPAMPLDLLGRFAPAAHPRASEPEPFTRSREFLWRDVPSMLKVHDVDQFERFFELVEGRDEALLQQQSLARELGAAHRTVVRWLQVLDACLLTLTMPPLDRAFSRRLVRRPKLHLLGSVASFESEVVTEIYRNARHAGLSPAMRYWRDSNGLEVPLIFQTEPGAAMVPCGIAPVPRPADWDRLVRWMRLAGVSNGAMIGRTAGPPAPVGSRILRYSLSDF